MRIPRITSLLLVLALAGLPLACGGSGGGGGNDTGLLFRVSGAVSGSVLEGVTIQLKGDVQMTRATDVNGEYEFFDVPQGRYSVVPELQGVTFAPPNRTADVVDRDVTGLDFTTSGSPPPLNTDPPAETVRLVFIHRDTGRQWLNPDNISSPWGDLGAELGLNNYYVSDVSTSWSEAPFNPTIGSTTDIGHWYTWFLDPTIQGNGFARRDNIVTALWPTNAKESTFTRIAPPVPLGDNEIVVFMSEPGNSALDLFGDTGPPNPLYGNQASDPAHIVPNCQEIYNRLLEYFKTRAQTQLFVDVTAPPLHPNNTNFTQGDAARILNDWLIDDWLRLGDWEGRNVAVFDLFNVLTDEDHHHRVFQGQVQHEYSPRTTQNPDANYSAYSDTGNQVSRDGLQKATSEFLPLLNLYYNRWQNWLP